MRKNYFLGLAANQKNVWRHLFVKATEEDAEKLTKYLSEYYDGEAILCKNGRSALAIALKTYFNKGDKIIVNGFTCYAVYEAVKAAGLTPVFADINEKDLNFDINTIEKVMDNDTVGIIVQNTLGNPVDIAAIERFAGKHGLVVIEDLAHSVGLKYADEREAGTVGAATVLSFGKDKAIDTTSGGAVILRHHYMGEVKAPLKPALRSDELRERFYPLFGSLCRKLTRIHLGGVLMRFLLKVRFVERSADNKLDLERKPADFEAKLALEQLKSLPKSNNKPLREFYFVKNRPAALNELKEAGYYFDGFWYEKPVSPIRYYKKVHFNEEACPVGTMVAEKIINLPTYYSKKDLERAKKIIEKYAEGTEND